VPALGLPRAPRSFVSPRLQAPCGRRDPDMQHDPARLSVRFDSEILVDLSIALV
jgi:hypothetical protein